MDNIPEDVTESEMFNHARREIIKSFSGENIAGLYLVESLHNTAHRATRFLMDCSLVGRSVWNGSGHRRISD